MSEETAMWKFTPDFKWKKMSKSDDPRFKCSECGASLILTAFGETISGQCPTCGASFIQELLQLET